MRTSVEAATADRTGQAATQVQTEVCDEYAGYGDSTGYTLKSPRLRA